MYVEGYWCGVRVEHAVIFKKKKYIKTVWKKLRIFLFLNRKA